MDEQAAERVADVLKAVGHPARLRIVEMLEGGQKCVGAISEKLGIKQSITSQHLNMMRDKGVLACEREGAKVYYRIANENVIKLLHCMYSSCENVKES